MNGEELTPRDVLDELDRHEELVVELYARDVDGLPATMGRLIDRAIDDLPAR